MANPTQWPSFDNLGVAYAECYHKRLQRLEAVTILIQRWFRHQKIHPILVHKWAYNMWNVRKTLQGESDVEECCLYEKLDGTNVGVRCDGAMFGRRRAIEGSVYQKCKLDGVVPWRKQVNQVKLNLVKTTSMDLPKMILYGELMVNNKYDYVGRGLFKKWFCFGAVFAPFDESCDCMLKAQSLVSRLQAAGFYATVSPNNGKVKLAMNPNLQSLLEECNVRVAPFAGCGPMKELCFSQKSRMLQNGIEGFVVSRPSSLHKWKTGQEDVSKGHDELCRLLSEHSKTTLEIAGIDIEFATLLLDIAGNNKVADSGNCNRKEKMKQKSVVNKKNSPYAEDVLRWAMDSARTKYDDWEVYFEREQRSLIAESLRDELYADLHPTTNVEQQAIEKFVNKNIGMAYGKWKHSRQSRS